ncbi:MAG: tetratricopeptide repeat protein [Stellaceae bacterium]
MQVDCRLLTWEALLAGDSLDGRLTAIPPADRAGCGPQRRAEIERGRRRPTERPDAHLTFLRGLASLNRWSKASTDEALRLAYQAIDLDPDYSMPCALAASCYVTRKTSGWTTDPVQDIAETAVVTARAAALSREDAVALAAIGFAVASVLGDLDAGAAMIDRALARPPTFAIGWAQSGYVRVWLGEPDVALDHLQRAIRLGPVGSMFMIEGAAALAHFIAGRYDDASAWAEKALQQNPLFSPATRVAVASAALLGRLESARSHLARLCQLDPGLLVSTLGDRMTLRRPDDHARLAEGLRRAGLPE